MVNLHKLKDEPKEKKIQLVLIGLWQYYTILLITIDFTKQF